MIRLGFRTLFLGMSSLALASHAHAQSSEARLMRYSDIAGNKIAFVYADKLWVANDDGSNVRTIKVPGTQLNRISFSPDGKRIALSSTVDGNVDIYVVSVDNDSAAQRLTYHPAPDLTVGWQPDGNAVLFASTMNSERETYNRLHTVSLEGGIPHPLPLPYGETATYTQDAKALIFTYLADFQEEAWKRYYGGRAPDLLQLDFATGQTKKLTTHQSSDSMPMVVGEQIYFLSERDAAGRSNIWLLGSNGKPDGAVTNYRDYDVRRPATDGKRIIFEVNGGLAILDPSNANVRNISVQINRADAPPTTRDVKVAQRIDSAALSPDGVIVEARGDILAYRSQTKAASNLTPTSQAAERFPRTNARGDIAYVSDADGEYALYVRTASNGKSRKVADFGAGLRYNPFWSPDGNKIAIWDYEQTLWLVNVASGTKTPIDQGKWGYHYEMVEATVSWSRDSRWLAYSRGLDNRNNAIFVYDTATQKRTQLTSGAYNDSAPIFDTDGNYLLALSHRHFDPTFGDNAFDATWTYTNGTVVSILPLRKDILTPDMPGWKRPPPQSAVTIDVDDIEQRLRLLPAKAGQLSGLRPTESGYLIVRAGNGEDAPNVLERYQFNSKTAEAIESRKNLSLSDADLRRILIRSEDDLFLFDTNQAKSVKVDLSGVTKTINIASEAQQIFNDSWRYARDFYYDPSLHGADWNAVRAIYAPLVPHVTNDEDINFIAREMVGELNGGHVYASATRKRLRTEATNVGMLGADFEQDDNGFRITKIYRTGARTFEIRSPLDDAALDVREGDYLQAVDGKPLLSQSNPWQALTGLAGKEVTLTISRHGQQPHDVRVTTITSERLLREHAWVEENRRKVESMSGGRIGYIYVPNTTTRGLNELMIGYRSQFNKDALLIDARFNTGGALGDRLVELLNRPPLIYFRARNSSDYPLPELANRGPKALLTNSWSYSGGDGFPLLFKAAKVGPVIGTRTWGGLIGPGLFLPLVNGGFISSPPQRVYGTNGQWSEGNEGVRPDIEVENDPGTLARGEDLQLDFAVHNLLSRLQDVQPVAVPAFQGKSDWNPAERKGKRP